MKNLINQKLLEDVLAILEDIKKKIASSSNSDNNDGNSDDTFSQLERTLTKISEESKVDKTLLGREKETVEIKKDDFEKILKELFEITRKTFLDEKEKKQRYQAELKETMQELDELKQEFLSTESKYQAFQIEKTQFDQIVKQKVAEKTQDNLNQIRLLNSELGKHYEEKKRLQEDIATYDRAIKGYIAKKETRKYKNQEYTIKVYLTEIIEDLKKGISEEKAIDKVMKEKINEQTKKIDYELELDDWTR